MNKIQKKHPILRWLKSPIFTEDRRGHGRAAYFDFLNKEHALRIELNLINRNM